MFTKRSKSKDKPKDIADLILEDVYAMPDLSNKTVPPVDIIEHPFKEDSTKTKGNSRPSSRAQSLPRSRPQSRPSSRARSRTNSRASSRASSRRSSTSEIGSFYTEFLKNVRKDKSFMSILNSGLGKVLINQTAYIEELARRNNLKIPDSHFDNTIDQLEDFLEDFNAQIQSSADKVNSSLDSKIKNHLSSKRNSYFQSDNSDNFHIDFFADPAGSDRLSDSKLALVNNTFPIRQKFSGNGNPSITEFLRNLKFSQSQCMLTEKQFKTIFLRCTTGSVYEHVACLIDGDISINEIINSLLLKYDTRLKPEEATLLLNNYVAPKTADFSSVISDIMSLAQRSVLSQPPQCRKAIYDYSATDILIKNLPTDSQNDGRKIKADLYRELERTPTFDEVSRALMPYSSAIDFNYSKDRKSKIFSSLKNTHKISPLNISNNKPFIRRNNRIVHINEINTLPNKGPHFSQDRQNFSSSSNPNNKNGFNQRSPALYDKVYKNKPSFQNAKPNYSTNYNKQYNAGNNYTSSNARKQLSCKLCGKGGHTSTGFCWEMRTNSGAFTLCNPVPLHCDTCMEEYSKELFHSDDLCPLRPRALWLKQNDMWKPPSKETRLEMDRKAAKFFR